MLESEAERIENAPPDEPEELIEEDADVESMWEEEDDMDEDTHLDDEEEPNEPSE